MKNITEVVLLTLMLFSANFADARNNQRKEILIKRINVPLIYTTVGTIRSRDEIALSPRITARIIEVRKWGGDSVKKGELLIKLDDQDLKAAKNRLEATMRESEAALNLAQTKYDRAKTLYSSKAVSKSSFDQAEKDLKAAKANLNALQREIELAQARLSYASIKAPFNGIVSERFANPGDMAAPSKVLMGVFDPTKLMLYASISESLAKQIHKNDEVEMYIDAVKKKIKGKIVEIVPSIDETSRTFTVKISTKENENLMPGMFGTFYLQIGSTREILIPENAIIRIGQLEYANIADKVGEKRQIMIRTVPCHFDPTKRRVTAGLKEGMTVILGNN
jgi:RND family efflux transporter MFP subunit